MTKNPAKRITLRSLAAKEHLLDIVSQQIHVYVDQLGKHKSDVFCSGSSARLGPLCLGICCEDCPWYIIEFANDDYRDRRTRCHARTQSAPVRIRRLMRWYGIIQAAEIEVPKS